MNNMTGPKYQWIIGIGEFYTDWYTPKKVGKNNVVCNTTELLTSFERTILLHKATLRRDNVKTIANKVYFKLKNCMNLTRLHNTITLEKYLWQL